MYWEKQIVLLPANGQLYHDTYSAKTEDGYELLFMDAGSGKSKVLSKQEFDHWVIAYSKDGTVENMIEPSYKQKLQMIQEVGRWKQCALEVMPPVNEVVDRKEVYHLWEFEFPYSFIYNIAPIFDAPTSFEKECDGTKYHISQVGKVRYLYLKHDGKTMFRWRDKQAMKNKILDLYSTAVEIIIDGMENKSYTCLVCLPAGERLDFGLI